MKNSPSPVHETAQVALSVVLLGSSGLLVRSFFLLHRGPGALGLGPDGDPPTSRAAAPVIAGSATWPDITRSAPAAMAARKGANSSERSRSVETDRTGSA